MTPQHTSRSDMHCHSTASQLSKLDVQQALGLPECATPPQEVYALAKERGMDFVTITDHDTIAGVLEIAHMPDVFVSEELTTWFRGEPQAVHVLCYGITADDHDWLQAHAGDVELVAEYLCGNDIACALAHPFYAVEAPLTPRHRRRLAQLFPVWEVRNGSRAAELNLPAAVYIETHGGTGIAGSDDHAGVDIGRTWTETPRAATPAEFLEHLRSGRADARGDQGSAAKWAHAAMALAIRVLGSGGESAPPNPRTLLTMVERIMREGDHRGAGHTPKAGRGDTSGGLGAQLAPENARGLLRAWLASVELGGDEHDLLAMLQDPTFSHAALERRARRCHERKLRAAVDRAIAATDEGRNPLPALTGIFEACVAAIPYAPATAFLGREKAKLARRDGEPARVALIADGVGDMHGVTRTLEEIRERGVPGFDVEVIGTDASVDRRLSAVAEVDMPYYKGLKIGVPSLPAVVDALADGRYDLVHLCSPGPAGIAAGLVARVMELPVVGSYHTELAAYARVRTADPMLEAGMRVALGAFYGQAQVVLSPSAASDDVLAGLGIPSERIGRWDRGVDLGRFAPEHRVEGLLPGEVNVLYAGRLTHEKGADLLADAFLRAKARDPRLHLCLAGGGPEEDALRDRLGDAATFLGWLEGEDHARAYASADVFLFASRTDTFGQVLLEAQASGLPIVAVDEGGPSSIVTDGVSGLLRPADPGALADALVELAASPQRRERLAAGGRNAVADRTWERALWRLADGYRRALTVPRGAALQVA